MQEQSRSPFQVIAILVINTAVAFLVMYLALPATLSVNNLPLWLPAGIVAYITFMATFLTLVPARDWDYYSTKQQLSETIKNLLFSTFLFFVGSSVAFGALSYFAGLMVRENSQKLEKEFPSLITTEVSLLKTIATRQGKCTTFQFESTDLEVQLLIEAEQKRVNSENFYTNYIFPTAAKRSQKKFTISEKVYPAFAYNDRIYLHSLNLVSGQTLLPEIGPTLLTCLNFPEKSVAPVFAVVAPEIFQKDAAEELDHYIAEVRVYITKLESNLNILEGELQTVRKELAAGRTLYTKSTQTSLEYSISQTKNAISKGRSLLKEALQQKTIVSIQWGRFSPPNTISINFLPELANNPEILAEVVVHEQFHYQTSNSFSSLPSFFEESLTQHLTLKTVHLAGINRGKYSSYAYPTFIVRQMMKKIPESTWIDIYRTKDAAKLERTLDTAYGAGFYKKYQNHFIMMTFGRTADVIQYANDVLQAMGEPQLIENELANHYNW